MFFDGEFDFITSVTANSMSYYLDFTIIQDYEYEEYHVVQCGKGRDFEEGHLLYGMNGKTIEEVKQKLKNKYLPMLENDYLKYKNAEVYDDQKEDVEKCLKAYLELKEW